MQSRDVSSFFFFFCVLSRKQTVTFNSLCAFGVNFQVLSTFENLLLFFSFFLFLFLSLVFFSSLTESLLIHTKGKKGFMIRSRTTFANSSV